MLKFSGFVCVLGIVLYLHNATPAQNLNEPNTHPEKVGKPVVNTVRETKHSTPPVEKAALEKPILPDKSDIVRGMALQISYTAGGIAPYIKAIDEIADLGANTVGLSTAGYQEHAGSVGITLDIRKCPSQEQFRQIIQHAKKRGLRVVLMPVLLLSNPRGSEWRGVINPPSWDEWFSSYLEFIKYFAKISLDNDVDAMSVGAELISTESFRDRWDKVIAEVRKIYHGKLFYSSNWDHYRNVTFWDKLDWIGMTSYHKLADEENPKEEVLLKSWSKIKKEILGWRKDIGKPILFTEVGWCSQPGASIEAWNYYRHQTASKAGLLEQKKCYEAFIHTWGGEKNLAGAMWWEWTLDGCGPEDFGYTPKGKPAEEVLKQWYQQGRKNGRLTKSDSKTLIE